MGFPDAPDARGSSVASPSLLMVFASRLNISRLKMLTREGRSPVPRTTEPESSRVILTELVDAPP
jgi:hypothetical protein